MLLASATSPPNWTYEGTRDWTLAHTPLCSARWYQSVISSLRGLFWRVVAKESSNQVSEWNSCRLFCLPSALITSGSSWVMRVGDTKDGLSYTDPVSFPPCVSRTRGSVWKLGWMLCQYLSIPPQCRHKTSTLSSSVWHQKLMSQVWRSIGMQWLKD